MDHHIGRVLAALRERKTDRDTVVAVVSDHGEAFGERGDIGHGRTLFEAQLHVPFVLWAPTRIGHGRDVGISSNLDVAPTLLHVLGIAVPASMRGRNLIPLRAARPPGEAYAEALVTGPELYSLRGEDGVEIWNATAGESVSPEGPRAVRERLQHLIEQRPPIPEGVDAEEIEVKGDVREGLRALGYVE
jgi:arylsulfatase A-like enzyme